jgi:hypothetical protein
MENDQARVDRLATILGLPSEVLGRHLVRPLPSPSSSPLHGWLVPEICKDIFAVTDGFQLFGPRPWNGFHFWGSQDYNDADSIHEQVVREHAIHDQVHDQVSREQLFPFFGDIPHLVSISVPDGAVVCTDWEDYHRPERGWRQQIAANLKVYFATLILVREAYGYEDDSPSDWWSPYASHGTRFDLKD